MNKDTPTNPAAERLGVPGPVPQVRIVEGLEADRFAIRGDIILRLAKRAGRENPHQISAAAGTAYQTARRYLIAPGTDLEKEPKAIDLEKLFAILIKGAGLTWEDLAVLPFGAIFAVLTDETAIATELVIRPGLINKEEDNGRG